MAEREVTQRERERQHPHGWGDLRTWILLGILIVGGITHTFIIHAVVGEGVAPPDQWNLGFPPTAPN